MKTYKIYTDGSHLKHTTGRLGIGGILVGPDGKIVREFSTEVSRDYMKVSYGTDDVSNPTCEMLAVYVALSEFKKELRDADLVISLADYQGVQGWLGEYNKTKPWKITRPYIQRIKDDIDDEISKQELRGKIRFDWVKGHQTGFKKEGSDAWFNDRTDQLAKGIGDGNLQL